MLNAFRKRLFYASLLLFLLITVTSYFVVNYINTFKYFSEIQLVIYKTSNGLLEVKNDVASIIYLNRIISLKENIAKIKKVSFNSQSIKENILNITKEAKLIRKKNLTVLLGFINGFRNEKFTSVYGVKKKYLRRIKNKEFYNNMIELRNIMKAHAKLMVKLLNNPLNIGSLRVNEINKFQKPITDRLNSIVDILAHRIVMKIEFLRILFLLLPVVALIILFLLSYYFKIQIKRLESIFLNLKNE